MKLSLLGLGSIGIRHARNALLLGADVVGFDPLPERREALEKIGGRTARNREEIFSRGAPIVVATPNEQHIENIRETLAAGLHVLVEKPLAHTCDGVAELLDSAEAQELCVFVGFNLRLHPAVIAARRILARDILGSVLWARFHVSSYLPDWRPNQEYAKGYAADPFTGGVLFDLSHELDLAQYLLGPATLAAGVARKTGTLKIESEDCADIILRHKTGVQSAVHLDYATPTRRRVTEIAGTDGFLELDLEGRTFCLTGKGGETLAEEDYDTSIDDDYVEEMKIFLACCRGEAEPPCNGREGLEALKLIVAARTLCGLPTT